MTDPAVEFVDYAKPAPGVARITLQRREALNAINLAMRDELWTFVQAVRVDPAFASSHFRRPAERNYARASSLRTRRSTCER